MRLFYLLIMWKMQKFIINILYIYIWLLSVALPNILYLNHTWYSFDMGLWFTILFILFSQFIFSIVISFLYFILFNFILKIRFKNIILYFLVLFSAFIALLMPDLWIINSLLIPILSLIIFLIYWYYLKFIKKVK